MKLLILDHFFSQDIDALRTTAEGVQFKVVPAATLWNLAAKYFPPRVFGAYSEYWRPIYADARMQYAAAATRLLYNFYRLFPFDAVVVPSDTFFHVRAWVDATRTMGLPFIVLQKETTISPMTMTEHSVETGKFFPFVSDLMLVCSEHHKQFWVRSGAPPDKIIVIGQPRFDFYRKADQWRSLDELGIDLVPGRPCVLFLSYDLDAYSPELGGPTWQRLRTESEAVLFGLARTGRCNVLIKPHPQQQGLPDYEGQLRAAAGGLWNRSIRLLSREFDTRQLIVNAAVVVGFQTTALLEAMIAGKAAVYTFWTEPTARFIDALIPFHEMDSAVHVATSADDLERFVARATGPAESETDMPRRMAHAERLLGRVDGGASRRALALMAKAVADAAVCAPPEAWALRRALAAEGPAFSRRALVRALAMASAWRLAEWLLPVAYPLWRALKRRRTRYGRELGGVYDDYRAEILNRRRVALETINDCRAVLKGANHAEPSHVTA